MNITRRIQALRAGLQTFVSNEPQLLQSWSQHGEDVLAYAALGSPATGFYLDIGAYHPTRFSNTTLFNSKGWHGCNVEPDPKRLSLFIKERSDDVNLNYGVADKPGTLTLYELDPDTESTFLPERAKGRTVIRETPITIVTLAFILDLLPPVDFCSIDVEGMDLAVLRGNDWTRHRPRLMCVEITDHALEICSLFQCVGYRNLAHTALNTLWLDQD